MRNWLKNVGVARGCAQVDGGSAGSRWDLGLEALEPRAMLDAAVAPGTDYTTEVVGWAGFQMEAVRDSFVLTFAAPQSREQAFRRVQRVADELGVDLAFADVSARGRFARIVTSDALTDAAAARAKGRFGFLRQVEPDWVAYRQLTATDARYASQWALNNTGQITQTDRVAGVVGADIDVEAAWNISTGSDDVVIAVLDTGIDLSHPDLRANLWVNPGEIPGNGVDDDGNGYTDDVNGMDFAADGATPTDSNPQDPEAQGHGTSVAGTIGAVGGNGIGVVGVNWNVSMIAIKVFPDVANTTTPTSARSFANDYLIQLKTVQGINIVASNNSYGALRPDDFDNFDSAEEISIQDLTDAGMLFVAAAGNDGNDNDNGANAYPAGYDNPDIISVASTNNRDQLSGFSNYGIVSVDVGAPGDDVLTTTVGGGYGEVDGTSFASPYTAGLVGLLAAVNPFWTKDSIKNALFSSVDPIPALEGRTVYGGRINALRAIQTSAFAGPVVAAVSPGPIGAAVSEIRVAFSEAIDPAFFSTSKVELKRSNLDRVFDANDVVIALNPGNTVLSGKFLTITLPGVTTRDLYRLKLTNDGFRDAQGNYLNGGPNGGNDEIYVFDIVASTGVYEPNDSFAQATPVLLDDDNRARLAGMAIGDGDNGNLDVDIFKIFAGGPSLISAALAARDLDTPSDLDTFARLFDSSGTELARNDNFSGLDSRIEYFVSNGGFFYLAVSAYPNTRYNPRVVASGVAGDTEGDFAVDVVVQSTADEPVSRSSAPPAVAIPATGAVTSTITFTDGRAITDLNVRVNLTHTYISDLVITLTGPSGQSALLFDRRGGSGDNITGAVFDDAAPLPIALGAAPFLGTFRPETSLQGFNDTSAAGTWTLTIQDLKAGDAGTFQGWALDLVLTNDASGPFELNDTALIASETTIAASGSRLFEATIGDGAFGLRDVDLFRFNAGAGTTIAAVARPTSTNTPLDLILRLFDSTGLEVGVDKRKGSTSAAITFTVANAGIYYIGVSGGNTTSPTDPGNDAYNPFLGGSGTPTDATGDYALTLNVSGGISEGQTRLDGNALSVGVGGDGAIGIPAGSNARGISLFGNEFLLSPFSIESFFGVTFNGFVARNAAGAQSDIAMSVANESDYANRRVVTSGVVRGMAVRRTLSFGVNDRYIAVDVTLTNRSGVGMTGVAWTEGFNPDQGVARVGTSSTLNNIDNATGRLATAAYADSAFPGGLTMGIGAPARSGTVFASFEDPGSVRDAFRVVDSPFDPDSTGDVGVDGDMTLAAGYSLGGLSPNESASFRYFIFADTSLAAVLNNFQALEAGTGTGHLAADPLAPAIAWANLPFAVYYPEGFANNRASTFLPLLNANLESARVVVIARYEGSNTEDVLFDSSTDSAALKIVGTKRSGITLTRPDLYAAGTGGRVQSEIAGRPGVRKDTPYALEIRSSVPVGAVLSHYDFGISTGEAFTSQLSTTWTFGDGQKGNGSNDFLIFYNPNPETVKVTLTVFPSGGGSPVQVLRTVQGFRRGGWAVNDIGGITNGSVAYSVEAERPVIAALTRFDTTKAAGYGALGLPSNGALSGGTPEGQIGLEATGETIAVLNPGNTNARVTFTFNFENGSSFRREVDVAARRRGGFNVQDLLGFPAGQAYAVTYTSTVPVAVTLPSFSFGEATGTTLVSSAATQWLFSEGFRPATGTAVQEYLRLYNPSGTETTVDITLNYNTGTSETFRRTIASRAGQIINIHDLLTGTNRDPGTAPGVGSFYGIRVQSSVPILAFQGHFDDFFGGGFGTLGTPLGTVGTVV